jgi:phage tail-like protein
MAINTAGAVEDKFLVGSWFTLELPKLTITAITEISGLALEVDVVEVQQQTKGGKLHLMKRPASAKFGDITVKRLLSADKSMWQWCKDIRDGKNGYRSDGSIVLFDISNKEAGRWNFTNAWPSKWSASDLDVGQGDPMTEELTLTVELLERVK